MNFTKKHPLNKVKNNKKLEKKYLELYSKYRSTTMEVDADNVALALLYRIDKTKNRILGRYADKVFKLSQESKSIPKNDERTEIRAFIERARTNHFGFGRIDNIVNTKIWFQSAYHGTPHRFDEFSLENIGTGEGHQAHGWGLFIEF